MIALMTKRPRAYMDCPEYVRRAINAFAAEEGISPSEVMLRAVTAILPAGLVDRMRAKVEAEESGAAPPPPRSKRGRKPKGSGG